jgi:hypothetical protein
MAMSVFEMKTLQTLQRIEQNLDGTKLDQTLQRIEQNLDGTKLDQTLQRIERRVLALIVALCAVQSVFLAAAVHFLRR